MKKYSSPFILVAREYTCPIADQYMNLAAFHPRFLHLSQPDLKIVINKRKQRIINQLDEKLQTLLKEKKVIDSLLIQKQLDEMNRRKKDLDHIINSIQNDKNLNIIRKLSNYNTRHFLKILSISLSSGYLSDVSVVEEIDNKSLIESLILGNNEYHNPGDTAICNLFDNETITIEGNSLIRIRLLEIISMMDGKNSVSDIMDKMSSIGYLPSIVLDSINKFIRERLVMSDTGIEIKYPSTTYVKITSCGKFYLEKLCPCKHYLQEMIYSTHLPIPTLVKIKDDLKSGKKGSSSSFKRRTSQFSIPSFISYIETEEQKEKKRIENLISKDDKIIFQNTFKPIASYLGKIE